MNCTACGAAIGPSQPKCSYCGALTPFGQQQQALQQQQVAQAQALELHRDQQEREQKRATAMRSIKRTADASMYWGIAGWVLCCFFVPSFVALVLAVRARRMARRYDLVIPTTATLGLVFGGLGLASGVGLITIGVVEDYRKSVAIEQLDQQLEGKLEAHELTQPTACLLAKRSLLKGEFQGEDRSLDTFDCDGKLTLTGDKGVLEDVRFSHSKDHRTVRVCFAYGARWRVAGFRTASSCDEPEPVAAPSGS
jgi:hypothetical protein